MWIGTVPAKAVFSQCQKARPISLLSFLSLILYFTATLKYVCVTSTFRRASKRALAEEVKTQAPYTPGVSVCRRKTGSPLSLLDLSHKN